MHYRLMVSMTCVTTLAACREPVPALHVTNESRPVAGVAVRTIAYRAGDDFEIQDDHGVTVARRHGSMLFLDDQIGASVVTTEPFRPDPRHDAHLDNFAGVEFEVAQFDGRWKSTIRLPSEARLPWLRRACGGGGCEFTFEPADSAGPQVIVVGRDGKVYPARTRPPRSTLGVWHRGFPIACYVSPVPPGESGEDYVTCEDPVTGTVRWTYKPRFPKGLYVVAMRDSIAVFESVETRIGHSADHVTLHDPMTGALIDAAQRANRVLASEMLHRPRPVPNSNRVLLSDVSFSGGYPTEDVSIALRGLVELDLVTGRITGRYRRGSVNDDPTVIPLGPGRVAIYR